MLEDRAVEDGIRSAIAVDPRISDPAEIAVVVENGAATLRGTVESFAQRHAAASDARSVDGVYELRDQLAVQLLKEARREDAELRGVALQALMWDVEVPAAAINVKVSEGWVTLKGEVEAQHQSDAAFADVARLVGVTGVTNKIRVTTF